MCANVSKNCTNLHAREVYTFLKKFQKYAEYLTNKTFKVATMTFNRIFRDFEVLICTQYFFGHFKKFSDRPTLLQANSVAVSPTKQILNETFFFFQVYNHCYCKENLKALKKKKKLYKINELNIYKKTITPQYSQELLLENLKENVPDDQENYSRVKEK